MTVQEATRVGEQAWAEQEQASPGLQDLIASGPIPFLQGQPEEEVAVTWMSQTTLHMGIPTTTTQRDDKVCNSTSDLCSYATY